MGQRVSSDGKTLDDRYQKDLGAGIIKWNWVFRFQ